MEKLKKNSFDSSINGTQHVTHSTKAKAMHPGVSIIGLRAIKEQRASVCPAPRLCAQDPCAFV